jgi:hypothetical protein
MARPLGCSGANKFSPTRLVFGSEDVENKLEPAEQPASVRTKAAIAIGPLKRRSPTCFANFLICCQSSRS